MADKKRGKLEVITGKYEDFLNFADGQILILETEDEHIAFLYKDAAGKGSAKHLAKCWNAFEEGGLVDELLAACEKVLRVKDLILPKGGLIKEEHADEVRALIKMFDEIEQAIAKAK